MKEPFVAIIDYGMGNLYSVKRACEGSQIYAEITSENTVVQKADGIILPGVGAFGSAMETLRNFRLVEPIVNSIRDGKPFLGICLGMQLLMTQSEEFGIHEGLNIFQGDVIQFPHTTESGERIKVPNVGWSRIHFPSGHDHQETALLNGVEDCAYMYFVHSFRVVPFTQEHVVTTSFYEGISYVSGISRDNVTAFQFHPERSAEQGIMIYKNFKRLFFI